MPRPDRSPLPRASALFAALALGALSPGAFAHGGSYAGPGTVPTGAPIGPSPSTGLPSPAGMPGVATGAMGLRASWEDWWHFNKDPFLELKRAVGSGLPVTAADEFLSGHPAGSTVSAEVLRTRAAPALRHQHETERSPEIVTAALVALGRVCGPPANGAPVAPAAAVDDSATVALFAERLRDPNQEIAETAALSLGILQSEASLPILEALLLDTPRAKELSGGRSPSDRTRAFAAYGLGLVADRARNNRARQIAARALCASLVRADAGQERRAPNSDVEVAAVIGLSLDRLDPEHASSASGAWISRQSELRFLRAVCEDAHRPAVVRAHAVTALARLAAGAPDESRAEVQELLLGSLRARSRMENAVLESSAQGLGLLGEGSAEGVDRKIRNGLAQVLDDPDVQTRCFALMALAETGSRGVVSESEDEGPTACRNLLSAALIHGRGMERPWAALALGVLERKLADLRAAPGGSTAKPAAFGPGSGAQAATAEHSREILRGYLAAAKQRTHLGAGAIALGLCRDRKAVPMLLDRLSETNQDQGQGYVALALGMIGDVQAVRPLLEIVRASKYKPEILEQASIALALLGEKSAAPELAELLAKSQGQAAQASLATALGRIGDERTIGPLLKLIDRQDLPASARAFAAAALGQVADVDPMPWYTPIAVDLNYTATTGTLLAGDGTGLLEIL
jgi:HEAT repeat protein